ncbi:MAG TPA: siderophore-interacting protein, partial [Caulobacteraceae bacterium]|nr:siderophore-interacting protein [Caulobacteraceae bacterium]
MDQTVGGFLRRVVEPRPTWRLVVEAGLQITPGVRRLRFSGQGLDAMAWTPGQDLVLNLPTAPRRHYTIRALRDGVLDIDFVLHGHGPAAAWGRDALPGAEIEAVGPRGRTRLAAQADWHLFVGDETCVPAIFAMLEVLPA